MKRYADEVPAQVFKEWTATRGVFSRDFLGCKLSVHRNLKGKGWVFSGARRKATHPYLTAVDAMAAAEDHSRRLTP